MTFNRTSKTRAMSLRMGTSLIEALLVILVLAATSATALMSLRSVSTLDSERQTAQSLVAALQHARDVAVDTRSVVSLRYDQSNSPASWRFTAAKSPYHSGYEWQLSCDARTKVGGAVEPIHFDPTGHCSASAEWQITGNSTYRVSLDAATAQATMKKVD